MTFLTPIPAMIAAALAVPALLFLYFLKLRRRPVRVSSTMLWDQATQDLQVNVPFRMIRASWLLLLQLIILALFLLALARPAVRMDSAPPAKLVILIDRSASMSARDGAPPGTEPATRLAAAKELARKLVGDAVSAGSGSRACIVEFAARPRALTPYLTDRAALRAAIDSIEPSDQPGDLKAALDLAGTLLANESTDESDAPRPGVAVLFSDGSFPPADGLALAGGEFRFRSVGRPPAPPEPGPEGEAPRPASVMQDHDNLGVTAISARREFDDPGVVRVFARLLNASGAPVSSGVTLRFNDAVIERRAVTVPGPGADGATPGESAATFQLSTRDAGAVVISLDRPDLLDSDNAAAVVLTSAARPRVILVVPDPPAPDPGTPPAAPGSGPEWMIADVLSEMNLRSMRTLTASAYEASPDAAATADLIIFDRVRPGRTPATPSLSLGAGLPTPAVSLEAAADEPTYFLSWDRSHPVMRDVALDTIVINRPRAIELHDAPGFRTAELARGRDGALIALLEERGVRHIVVGFALADSTWALHFGFPIFLAGAADYLTLRADSQAARAFTTVEPVSLRASGHIARVTLDGPIAASVSPAEGSGGALDFGVLELAGVYTVRAEQAGTGPDPGLPPAVAVNLSNAGESELAVRTILRVGGRSVETGSGVSGPREVWPWFVLAALVLLAVEWFLSAWTSRV